MEIAPDDHPRNYVHYEIQEDGDFLSIWADNLKFEDEYTDDRHIITMTRDVAIELAHQILKEMNFDQQD